MRSLGSNALLFVVLFLKNRKILNFNNGVAEIKISSFFFEASQPVDSEQLTLIGSVQLLSQPIEEKNEEEGRSEAKDDEKGEKEDEEVKLRAED